jgi:hypothetical protein
LKLILFANKYLLSTGPMYPSMEIYTMSDDTTYQQPTLFAEEHLVNPTALPARDVPPKTSVIFGPNSTASFASLDRAGLWLKTSGDYYQATMDGSLVEFSGTWPSAGIMQHGVCYTQANLARPTKEPGYSLLPTPAARDYRDCSLNQAYPAQRRRHQPSLATESLLAGIGGQHIAGIYVWAMGFPKDWLDQE